MKNQSNFMLRLASILFICVLVTTYMLTGLLARYMTTGTGQDEARVIRFGDIVMTESGDFTANGEVNEFIVIPGVDLTKDIHVEFGGSEAATCVFLELDLSNQWTVSGATYKEVSVLSSSKELIGFTIENDWTYVTHTEQKYVYSITLEPNTSLNTDVISENGLISVSELITKNEIKQLENTFVKAKAYVVQIGEFESAEDAWTSLASK